MDYSGHLKEALKLLTMNVRKRLQENGMASDWTAEGVVPATTLGGFPMIVHNPSQVLVEEASGRSAKRIVDEEISLFISDRYGGKLSPRQLLRSRRQ